MKSNLTDALCTRAIALDNLNEARLAAAELREKLGGDELQRVGFRCDAVYWSETMRHAALGAIHELLQRYCDEYSAACDRVVELKASSKP